MKYFKILGAAAVLLLLAAATLSGCQNKSTGGNTGNTPTIKKPAPKSSTAPESSATSTQIDVTEVEFSISPKTITVKKGDNVTFKVKNAGAITHVFMLEGMGSVMVDPGQTKDLKVTFNKVGKIKYFCNIDSHQQQGMVGELTVQ